MDETTCTIDGCGKPRYQKRRMCTTHVMRKHRYGDPSVDRSRTGNTWITENGYAKSGLHHGHPLADESGAIAAHRLALYEVIGVGPHPCHWCGTDVEWLPFRGSWDGVLVVDHLDGNKQNNHPSNLVAACFSCNILRGRWGDEAVRARRLIRT